MNRYKNALKLTEKFFQIEQDKDFGFEVFSLLKKIVDFESGVIYFTNPKRIEYSFNGKRDTSFLKEDLKFKNTKFGEIIIYSDKFSEDDKEIFKTCSYIISNITKDIEISKIIKMQAKALQDSCKEIKDAERIKTKFLSHMSHELRTPLNSILGFSDLLGNELAGPLNQKQKEFLNDINVSGLNLLEMINEILDMSKIEANAVNLNLREFEITTAVKEVTTTIKPLLLKKNILLINNIKNFLITADYQKLQQILFNLLSNAIKFTKENGKIIIDTEINDEYAMLSVEDTGIGIAEENLDKIFEKFEQVSESNELSTGLGLTITKELVKLHDGEIFVESTVGKGSIFKVKLPLRS